MPRPEQCAACHVVLQVEYAGTLLQTLRGDAMNHRLTHCHAAHLADPFVVPEAELVERRRRQAPRLTAIQQHRKHTACVHLALHSFGYERRAKEAVAKRSECLGSLLDACIDVVVI